MTKQQTELQLLDAQYDAYFQRYGTLPKVLTLPPDHLKVFNEWNKQSIFRKAKVIPDPIKYLGDHLD